MNRGNPHLVPAGIVSIIGCLQRLQFLGWVPLPVLISWFGKATHFLFGGWSQDLSSSDHTTGDQASAPRDAWLTLCFRFSDGGAPFGMSENGQ